MSELEHAKQAIEWLRTACANQLAENSLSVAQLSQQLTLVQSRLTGEQSLQQASWERRLASAQAEWGEQLDRVRAECASNLKAAEELLAHRADEADVAKEEARLLEAKLEFAGKKSAVQSNLLRQLLERVHGAELREVEVAQDMQARVVQAAQVAASHEEQRRRAEAERDVAMAALGILEGAEPYIKAVGNVAMSPEAREIAMLKARLKDSPAASHSKQEVAALRRTAAAAEARAAALDARLAAFEAEGRGRSAEARLLQRRLEEANAAVAAQQQHAALLARGRELDKDALDAKQLELEQQAALVAAAEAARRSAEAEAEASRRRSEQGGSLDGAAQRALDAVHAQNGALRRELAARQAELTALHARLRGQAEAVRLEKAAEKAAPSPAPEGGGGSVAAAGAAEEGVDEALAQGRRQAAEAQLAATREALRGAGEELRRSRREVQQLQRQAEAEAAEREATQQRLESAAELLRVAEQRQEAAEALAAAAQGAARAHEGEARAARAQSDELRRQQRAWQQEHEAHAGRMQLARRQEALLREQNELNSLLLAQQRSANRALETEVRSLETLNAQLEAQVRSYVEERRALQSLV